MSDHNFEKQVRRQMDEFRVRPSDRIWEALEQRLDQEKKPRRLYPWFLLATLILLGIGYGSYEFFFAADKSASKALVFQQPGNNSSSREQSAADIQRGKDSGNSLETETISPDAPMSAGITETQSGESSQSPSSTPPGNQTIATEEKFHKDQKTKTPASYQETVRIAKKPSIASLPDTRVLKSQLSGKEQDIRPSADDESVRQAPRKTVVAELARVSIGEIKAKEFDGHSFSNINSAKKDNASRWSWGLNVFYGRSAIGSGNFLNMKKTEVADLAYASPPPAMLPSPAITYQPADLQDGPSYTIGAFLRRELNSKLALSGGINYSKLSSRTFLGERINRSQIINSGNLGSLNVSYYYRPEQERSYKMDYGFLELPLMAHYKFNEFAKLPVELNAGIAVARMLSTNALHFDGTSGFYYENDGYFNRWQTTFDLGISAGLFKRSSTPVLIGPKLRYMFSSLHEKEISQKNRFLNFGVEAKISLGSFR